MRAGDVARSTIARTYTSSVSTADGREIGGEGRMSMGLCVLKVFHVGYAPCAAPLTYANASGSRFVSSMYACMRSLFVLGPRREPGVRGQGNKVGRERGAVFKFGEELGCARLPRLQRASRMPSSHAAYYNTAYCTGFLGLPPART